MGIYIHVHVHVSIYIYTSYQPQCSIIMSQISLQYSATHCSTPLGCRSGSFCRGSHCNTLQHTAPHCNTLQHTTRQQGWISMSQTSQLSSPSTGRSTACAPSAMYLLFALCQSLLFCMYAGLFEHSYIYKICIYVYIIYLPSTRRSTVYATRAH